MLAAAEGESCWAATASSRRATVSAGEKRSVIGKDIAGVWKSCQFRETGLVGQPRLLMQRASLSCTFSPPVPSGPFVGAAQTAFGSQVWGAFCRQADSKRQLPNGFFHAPRMGNRETHSSNRACCLL